MPLFACSIRSGALERHYWSLPDRQILSSPPRFKRLPGIKGLACDHRWALFRLGRGKPQMSPFSQGVPTPTGWGKQG